MKAEQRARLRKDLESVFTAGLEAVDPEDAVARFLSRREKEMRQFGRIFLVGAGKAGAPMARAVEKAAGERYAGGMVIVKEGHGGSLRATRMLEASHPEPGKRGAKATADLLEFLRSNVSCDDLLIVVLSGGGSALLVFPAEGVTLEDKKATTSALIRCGARIQEINAVRKHLSRVKGGRLLDYAGGCRVLTLILSDVVGDDIPSIASGPTSPDPSTFQDCREIVRRYDLRSKLPEPVLKLLDAAEGESPKPGDPRFERVSNHIVASNIQALEAAAVQARKLGYRPLILTSSLEGDTAAAAGFHVAILREILASENPVARPCCLISGGETTVEVKGDGKGGRNMEFVLQSARWVDGWSGAFVIASVGSDGNDGPTDAAGAAAFPDTAERAKGEGMAIEDFLDRNDSYRFFAALDDLIVTGPTRTNVMDLRFVLVG